MKVVLLTLDIFVVSVLLVCIGLAYPAIALFGLAWEPSSFLQSQDDFLKRVGALVRGPKD